jgi:cobalt-zinc-cadmium efflux system protein
MTRRGRLVVALSLNAGLVAGELVAAFVARSAGLVSDAGHNLADVAAIVLALSALRWAARPRSDARSYGNHRGTILAALANAALLAVVTFAVAALGVARLLHPARVDGPVVAGVAAAALVLNGVAVAVLRERGRDLNVRSVAAHLAADVASAAVVLVAGLVVSLAGQGAARADPAASLLVAVLVLVQAVRILRDTGAVLLESTPADIDLGALRAAVTAVPGVDEMHDLHVWSLSSEYRALSAHLVLSGHPSLEEAQAIGGRVRERVSSRFHVAHTTFEMECERCDEQTPDPCATDDVRAEGRARAADDAPGAGLHADARLGS